MDLWGGFAQKSHVASLAELVPVFFGELPPQELELLCLRPFRGAVRAVPLEKFHAFRCEPQFVPPAVRSRCAEVSNPFLVPR